MTDICLNPDCDKEMATIGVCFSCANSDYHPIKHGVDA